MKSILFFFSAKSTERSLLVEIVRESFNTVHSFEIVHEITVVM